MTVPDPAALRRGTSAETVARHIRGDIEAGRLRHQQQLPPTAQLAGEWGTSTATISRAMQQLAAAGLVINRHGAGRIVDYPHEPAADRRPQVVVIGGFAGSGKTELARVLARQTGWPMFDKDTVSRPLLEAALVMLGESPHDRESGLYLTTVRPAEYEALLAAVTENVECGTSAIVSAPFLRELADRAWCDRLAATLDSLGAELHVVWVRTNADSMRTYLVRRGAARDTWKLAHWRQYLDGIDADFAPVVPHRIVCNNTDSRPLQQQATELVTELRHGQR